MKKIKIVLILSLIIIIILGIFIISKTVKKYTEDRPYYFNISDDITIFYGYSIGIPTLETLNSQDDFLDILEIRLKGEELKKLQKILKTYSFNLDKVNTKDNIGVAGEYEIEIGNDKIYLDQDKALYTKDNKNYYLIDINDELFDFVFDVVYVELEKEKKIITANELYMSNSQIGSTTFTDKDIISEIINSIRFKELNTKKEQDIGQEAFILDFKNGIVLTTYTNSSLGKYRDNNSNEEYYVIFYYDSSEYLKNFLTEKVMQDEQEEYDKIYAPKNN